MCLYTVEITANMYAELREEARDHARLRNAYFEQVYMKIFLVFSILNRRRTSFVGR